MKSGKILVLSLALAFIAACAPGKFEAADLTQVTVTKTDDNGVVQKVCTIDATDYALDLHVQSFEMVDRIKGSIGFNIAKGILGSIGVSADIQGGRLDTLMELKHPVNLTQKYSSELSNVTLSKRQFSFKLDGGKLSADASYYYETPIAKLSESALKKNFEKLIKSAKDERALDAWQTRVTKIRGDSSVVIAAGASAGIQIGDLFDITNAQDEWMGEPCASEYIGAIPTQSKPAGRYKVVARTPDTATLVLIDENYQVKMGAIAQLAQTKEQKNRVLKRSVRLDQMSSRKIVIDGHGTVDFLDYMSKQLDPVIRDQGFYIRQ